VNLGRLERSHTKPRTSQWCARNRGGRFERSCFHPHLLFTTSVLCWQLLWSFRFTPLKLVTRSLQKNAPCAESSKSSSRGKSPLDSVSWFVEVKWFSTYL